MSKLRFVGLDVHKDTIVIAVAEEGQGAAVSLATWPHDVPKVIQGLLKLVDDPAELRVCYEAGPTGFGLCRRLKAVGSTASWWPRRWCLSSRERGSRRIGEMPSDWRTFCGRGI